MREVRNLQILARQRVFGEAGAGRRTIRVRLGEGIAYIVVRALDRDDELRRTAEADVRIQIVVLVAGQHQIFHVGRTAESLDAVVRAVVDLDMIKLRAGTDARRGQALQFLAVRQHETGITDLDIAHAARIVGIIVTAIERAGRAFGVALAGGGARSRVRRLIAVGDLGAAEQHDAAPLA